MVWGDVPAYGDALDRVLGSGALPRLIEELDLAGPTLLEHGRQMFGNWLDVTVEPGG